MKNYKDVDIADRNGDLKQTWYIHYKFLIPGTTSKWKRFRITGNINRYHTLSDRREAARLCRAEMEQMLREGYNPFSEKTIAIISSEMSLGSACEYYHDNHVANSGERSKEAWRYYSKLLLSKINADTPVSSIKGNMIRDALNQIQREKALTNRTRNNILQGIYSLFQFLVMDEDVNLRDNPCKFVKRLEQASATLHVPPTAEQFEVITNHLYETNKHLLLAMSFILYLSLRTNELGKIQRKQLVTYQERLAITLDSSQVKNKRSRLQLIPPDLAKLMIELDIANLPPDWFIFGVGLKPGEKKVKKFRNMAGRIWKEQVKDKLGMNVGLYSNKHFQASALASKGIDERLIQKWADHKDVQTTRNYIRANVPQMPAELMDDMIRLPMYEKK